MSIISNHCFQVNLQAFVCFHEEIEDIIAIFWTWISKILRIFTAECKAVRYWSCPLSRNRDRIILHRRSMPKWAQTYEKILSQVGPQPTTSRFWGRHSTGRATVAVDFCVCELCAKCDHAVYSKWKCRIVGLYYNRIAFGFRWQTAQPLFVHDYF